jgi:hypothetical protein
LVAEGEAALVEILAEGLQGKRNRSRYRARRRARSRQPAFNRYDVLALDRDLRTPVVVARPATVGESCRPALTTRQLSSGGWTVQGDREAGGVETESRQ